MNEIQDTKDLIGEVLGFMSGTPWESDYKARLERLSDLCEMPCELAIAGKVKAGKSSFLNALLGVDLAMVGTTETTATINYFKYGCPEDPNRPVVVYWNDGRKPEAQTKEFLDSLQGHGKDVLERADKIDHLEYLCSNDILKKITLIDTPGVGSVEDIHEQRAADYFNPQRVTLRERHAKQSDSLTEGADAVVYISTPVPENNVRKFFGEYMPNISAFNALGVMTQIDRQNNAGPEVIHRMVNTLASSFRRELSTVVPVSAGVYHAVKKMQANGALGELQRKIRQIPEDMFQKRFVAIQHAEAFCKPEASCKPEEKAYQKFYDSCGLPYETRAAMSADMPWRVFYTIAIALYYKELDDAVEYLIDYSGMEKVMTILEKQFFSRSHAIRCSKIVKEIQEMLVYLKNVVLPELKSQSLSREEYFRVVDFAKECFNMEMLDSLKRLIDKSIPALEMCDRFSAEIDTLLVKADELRENMTGKEKSSEGLHLLSKMSNMLRNEQEVEELEILFGKYIDKTVSKDRTYLITRQRIWYARLQRVQNNKELSKLITLAYTMYGKLLND